MSPRSLFNVILKIIGIFFIQDFFSAIPQLLTVILYITKPDTVYDSIWTSVASILTICIYGFISYYLIFKSEFVIDKLKLDKGFDQGVLPLNIHRSTVLSIAIIVVAGLMLANEIPNFCRQLFLYYQERRMIFGSTNPKTTYLVFSVAKILIGILLLINQRHVVDLIEKKRKN